MKKKKIPIGIDDFDNLIRDNYYFIDKSLLIKDIVEDETSKIILLPRPRRFGKSLNMSMLKYFFTNKNKEKNRELFNNLKIEQETETMEKQGKYPLLYMSFKDIKTLDWENCYNKVKNLIQDLYSEYEFLLNENISMTDKKKIEKIIFDEANQSDYESSLKLLTKLLYDYYGERVIILIDEYDQAIISSYMNDYYKEGISFFRNLLSTVLKDNVYLEKAVLTGILRIAKESIFSGLNNLWVDSIINNKVNYFGLSEEEVWIGYNKLNKKNSDMV